MPSSTVPFPVNNTPQKKPKKRPGFPARVSTLLPLQETLRTSDISVLISTLDLETLALHTNAEATVITPKLIVESLKNEDIYYHLWVAVRRIVGECGGNYRYREAMVHEATGQLLVELGRAMQDRVNGPHISFIDPRLTEKEAIVQSGMRLAGRFRDAGFSPSEIMLSIPATEAGIVAGKTLQQQHAININLELVCGLTHTAVCSSAETASISVPVGPILDWHELNQGENPFTEFGEEPVHSGVELVETCLAFVRMHADIKTQILGTDFRRLSDISVCKGISAVVLTQKQISNLRCSKLGLSRQTEWPRTRARQVAYPMPTEKTFRAIMSRDTRRMLNDIHEVTLENMIHDMHRLEKIVRAEVELQLSLIEIDIESVVRQQARKAENPKQQAKSKGRIYDVDKTNLVFVDADEYF